jgi:hypothetical protein
MEDSKTLLFYLLSFAGLIVASILFTGRIEQPAIESQQPAIVTPAVTKLELALNPPETEQEPCSSINQAAFYTPDLTHLEGNRLVISGTLYTSDLVTPLPNASIKVWLFVQESYQPPYRIFYDRVQTDQAGRYEATVPKPDHSGIIYLHYQANDQAHCPLKMQLFFLNNPTLGGGVSERLIKLGLAQGDPAGSVLRGPIDVVLSIPPEPELSPHWQAKMTN